MQFIQCNDSFDLIRFDSIRFDSIQFDSIHSFKKRHIDAMQKERTLEEERVHRAKDLQFRLLLMRKSGHLLGILIISPSIMCVDP